MNEDLFKLRKKPTDVDEIVGGEYNTQKINIIIFGESGVGKTNLIKRFCENEFQHKLESTCGVDFSVKKYKISGQDVRLNIWDLAGHQKFFEVRNEFYKYAEIALLVFDVSNRKSFEKLSYWMNESKKCEFNYKKKDNILCVVGNKIDVTNRSVSSRRGSDFGAKYKLMYFETSAENGTGVKELFETLLKTYFSR